VREVLEETGYTVKTIKLAAIHDINKHQPGQFQHSYKLFFICDILSGAPTTSVETSEIKFFSKTNLPPLSTRRTTPGQIQLVYRHFENPTLTTEFD
jgi:ADP-ribose pyrophosphatase YjhB (NUDIX family)